MDQDIKYKSGTILTDGKNLIYLGSALERNWTPKNNHGRKRTEYMLCNTYPKSLTVGNTLIINRARGFIGEIPGIWFQEGYMLNHFKPINKKLLNPDIITKLIA